MIIIVDDYRDGAEALCRLLSLHGFSCRWANSGHEALAIIRAHPPEQPLLVVLDDMMPEMTGIETLVAIRADPKLNGTTVIMYSAGFDVAKRDEAITLGAAAWLLKGGAGGTTVQAVIDTITRWYAKVGGVPLRQDEQNAGL